LRLGFVSPHFAFHPVGYFLVRLLENLPKSQFDVVCYSDTASADALTSRLQMHSTKWFDVRSWSDERLAQQIRQDEVDILFDLAGHTPGNRLLVFARKPAPIQMTWLDYVGTTGLSAIDYIIADPRQIPPGAESYYTEKVLRLPYDYICFDPPPDAPPVNSLPALENEFVTFASFNILPKVTPQMIAIWARILKEVPRSRLMLKNGGFDNPQVAARLRQQFIEKEIDPQRIVFEGRSPHSELLSTYNKVDIGLDTFPYNGGLTTCEALWMGVPVVTFPGEIFASRHGLAHLTAAGITETIASSLEDYVKIAAALAGNLIELNALRTGLRARVASSPLCDGSEFAKKFSGLLRETWRSRGRDR
jgi:predicted O-linked N-acetylglucosamine transferase (SPINDLY family)